MAQSLVFSPPLSQQEYPVDFACRVAKTSILCFGSLDYSILQDDVITINDNRATSLRLGTVINKDGQRHTLFVFTFSNDKGLDTLDTVHIERSGQHVSWKSDTVLVLQHQKLGELLQDFSAEERRKTFFLLSQLGVMRAATIRDPVYTRSLNEARKYLSQDMAEAIKPQSGFWASAHMLVFDMTQMCGKWSKPHLCITTGSVVYFTPLTTCTPWYDDDTTAPPDSRYLLCAWFDKDIREQLRSARYTIIDGTKIMPLHIAATDIGGAASATRLITCIQQFTTQQQQQTLREKLMQVLLSYSNDGNRLEVQNLALALQHFISASHSSVVDMADPVGANVEYALPIGDDRLFVYGWIRDPYEQIETIEAIADIGFKIAIDGQLHYFPRTDVQEIYREQNIPADENCARGFIAVITIADSIRDSYKNLISPLQYRFCIRLRSGIEYYINPPYLPLNDSAAKRDLLLKEIITAIAGDDDGEEILSSALTQLQKLATDKPQIKTTVNFGESPEYPAISLIIPIYGCSEFVPVQLSHFAADAFVSSCEIIYVLDQPSQERNFRTLLENLYSIHKLPLKLLVMEQNYGYATACNIGAETARGTHLCFLNSDVMPRHYGWLENMWNAFAGQESAGAMAPTLLFANDSIQHGGMYFSLRHSGCPTIPTIKHFGKGRGLSWLDEQQEARVVPAVTGACMMVEKLVFTEAGGFDGNFLFGDFEDAHLCLKLAEKGLHNIYLPQVSLYHCERQSLPLLDSYSDNRAFSLNARRFYKRWKKQLDKIIADKKQD